MLWAKKTDGISELLQAWNTTVVLVQFAHFLQALSCKMGRGSSVLALPALCSRDMQAVCESSA